MKNLKLVAFVALSLLLQYSCKDQYDFSMDNLSTSVEETSEFALPIADASIKLSELLPDQTDGSRILIIDPDNFMRLEMNFDIKGVPASEYFNGDYSGPTVPDINYQVGTQVIDLKLNKFVAEGEFYIADPKITISIKNYWDVPTQFRLKDFYFYEEPTSAGVPITGSILDWHTVNRPLSPGDFAMTDIIMDRITTNNLDDFFAAMPHHISFGADFQTITDPPTSYDISPTSVDSVNMKVEIPLNLRATNLVLNDTIDFNLGESIGNDTSTVKFIELSMILDNGFPLDIAAQIYFVDENYQVLDSISSDLIRVASASVSGSVVKQSTININKFPLESQKLQNLLQSKYLWPKIKINTAGAANNETVKLYSTYEVGLKLGALIKLKIKT